MPKPLPVWITINWKILKEMGIPDHLTCLLRNLYADQEATVRTGHGTTDWFQKGKGIIQGCILSLCWFNFMQSTSWETPGWKHKLESRLPGEISITSDMQMTPPRACKRDSQPGLNILANEMFSQESSVCSHGKRTFLAHKDVSLIPQKEQTQGQNGF